MMTQAVHDVALRPVGTDTVLQIGAECSTTMTGWLTKLEPVQQARQECSQLKLANGSLGFENVKVNIKDEHRDEQGELVIHGGIQLDGLTPASWGVYIEGKLAGKMLPVIAPTIVAQASGLAIIGEDRLRLYGKGPRPLVAGSVSFEPGQPLSVLARGIHREVSFSRGSLDISTVVTGEHRTIAVAFDGIGGKIDNEGLLERIDGEIQITDGAIAKAQLELDAESIPFNVPETLDLATLPANPIE